MDQDKSLAAVRKWQAANPEKMKEYAKKFKEAHPDYYKRCKYKLSTKNWYMKNRAVIDARMRKIKYGITESEYQGMILSQLGLCAICRDPFTRRIHVDHCHKSKLVRGLLCHNCNLGIGNFKDSIDRLVSAISYLSKGVSK